MPDVVMPRLSDSMEEGTILKWLVADGATVKRGDEIAEIETDKATMTYEADMGGVVALVAKEGETLPIGALIARIGEGSVPAAPVPAADETDSPEQAAAPPSAPPAPADIGTAKGAPEIVEPTRAQQLVARRMAESRATIPDFTLTTEIDMQQCVDLRSRLRAIAREDAPVPTFNDMIVKACALALREYPRANGAYRDGKFELYPHVNVGIAVAAQDSFAVPTIFAADRKSLGEIAGDSRALAERVRSREITPPELSGGTFTVSNLGMYGVTRFTAVINPPQAAILAVGALVERPAVRDGDLVARHLMDVTLACDHRILYGAEAAEFLGRIRELLEEPLPLVL